MLYLEGIAALRVRGATNGVHGKLFFLPLHGTYRTR